MKVNEAEQMTTEKDKLKQKKEILFGKKRKAYSWEPESRKETVSIHVFKPKE